MCKGDSRSVLSRLERRMSYLEDLVGESGGRLKVPGDERPIGGVSTDRIGAADQLSPAAQEQDVQRLLNRRLIDPQRLETHAQKR